MAKSQWTETGNLLAGGDSEHTLGQSHHGEVGRLNPDLFKPNSGEDRPKDAKHKLLSSSSSSTANVPSDTIREAALIPSRR